MVFGVSGSQPDWPSRVRPCDFRRLYWLRKLSEAQPEGERSQENATSIECILTLRRHSVNSRHRVFKKPPLSIYAVSTMFQRGQYRAPSAPVTVRTKTGYLEQPPQFSPDLLFTCGTRRQRRRSNAQIQTLNRRWSGAAEACCVKPPSPAQMLAVGASALRPKMPSPTRKRKIRWALRFFQR